MTVGDKVKIHIYKGFRYQIKEVEGIVEEICSNGICKVKVLLKYGGFKIFKGCIKDIAPIE